MGRLKPFCKRAGGKSRLASRILGLFPGQYELFVEPFVGGGAVYFAMAEALKIDEAWLSDASYELMLAWSGVKMDVESVIDTLSKWPDDKKTFLQLRDGWHAEHTLYEEAARFLYLNRATFNGLWRVNKQGRLNMPYGAPPKSGRDIVQADKLRAANKTFFEICTDLKCRGFDEALGLVESQLYAEPDHGMAVYCDPPYLPASETANFRTYTSDGCDLQAHHDLQASCRKVAEAGATVVVSESDSKVVRDIWKGWQMVEVQAARVINCKGDGRGKVGELLIYGGGRHAIPG